MAAAALALLTASAQAQDDVQVLEETEPEAATAEDTSDDGGWSDDSYEEDEGGGASAIHFGLRTGWGIPLGESAGGQDFSDGIVGQIPIWLDLGWQATPKLMLGLYFSYGFVLLEDDICPDGSDCSASDVRLGAQVQFSFSPRKPVDFWLGGGAGYEWASTTVDNTTASTRGFEFLMLQLGVDFGGDDSGSTVFGPFAAYTIGQFDKAKTANGQSFDVEDKGLHNWLFLGVRGVMK
jgi:hypothetical protein